MFLEETKTPSARKPTAPRRKVLISLLLIAARAASASIFLSEAMDTQYNYSELIFALKEN